MDSLWNAVLSVNGNLQAYKQLLPFGKNILNNNTSPVEFIVKQISEEVDSLCICGVLRVVEFQVWGMSGCARERYKCDTVISWGVCLVGTPTVILYKDTETSSWWHNQETLQMSVYSQLTTPTAFTRKMVAKSNFKNRNVNQCLKLYSAVRYNLCTYFTHRDR